MKYPALPLLAFGASLGLSTFVYGSDATAYLSCTSISVYPASVIQFGMEYDLSFEGSDGSANNELLFNGNSGDPKLFYSIASMIIPFNPDPLVGTLSIDLPLFSDADGNGQIDFLEVAKSVPGVVTSGTLLYDNGFDTFTGTVSATWTRGQGAATGSVSMRAQITDFGVDITFRHPFEIYQYKGNLSYTNTAAGASTALAVSRLGHGGTISGPLSLVRTNATNFGFPAGAWSDETGAALAFGASSGLGVAFHRDAVAKHFLGYLLFDDGQPQTPAGQEYQLWRLDVFDANDVNQNGIPDLGEVPVVSVTPVIAIHAQGGGLQFSITAKKGQQVVIEQSPSLSASVWTTAATVTLAADTDTASLALPAGQAAFYRAR